LKTRGSRVPRIDGLRNLVFAGFYEKRQPSAQTFWQSAAVVLFFTP
jgi:hypothetical protein